MNHVKSCCVAIECRQKRPFQPQGPVDDGGQAREERRIAGEVVLRQRLQIEEGGRYAARFRCHQIADEQTALPHLPGRFHDQCHSGFPGQVAGHRIPNALQIQRIVGPQRTTGSGKGPRVDARQRPPPLLENGRLLRTTGMILGQRTAAAGDEDLVDHASGVRARFPPRILNPAQVTLELIFERPEVAQADRKD